MNKIAVFCGSHLGSVKVYKEQAYMLGKALASEKLTLVYGGSKTGLMGEIANGILNHNGNVVGVIPNFLVDKELAHDALTELIYVETMHERKAKMNALSDGFIILPGGLGTMEEFFEMLTWAQLRLHQKPLIIFNIDGFYNPLMSLINQMVEKGFINETSKKFFKYCTSVETIIKHLHSYRHSSIGL